GLRRAWASRREAARQAMAAPWIPAAAGAAALALALTLTVGLTKGRRLEAPAPDPVIVALAAFRGGDPSAFAGGPSGRRLALSIDAADLPAAEAYQAEVVNATGRRVWLGPATLSSGSLSLEIDRGFQRGIYWVRLYAPPGRLLREFGLR